MGSSSYTNWLARYEWLAGGKLMPDSLIRIAVRAALKSRLKQQGTVAKSNSLKVSFADDPIAVETSKANRQHYEVPTEFFGLILGPRLKYSSAFWPDFDTDLASAEDAMLETMAERAALEDGQRILDLGSGWGAFSIWAAQRYSRSEITAISNSRTQEEFIRSRAATLKLTNLTVMRRDVASLDLGIDGRFDRIVSVEMLEHIRNAGPVLDYLSQILERRGCIFAHVFSHMKHTYTFEIEDGWMAKWFFSGGMMPNIDHYDSQITTLKTVKRWVLNGQHYARTLRAWLCNLDMNREAVLGIFREFYGPKDCLLWVARWRLFLIACEELFAYQGGREWVVVHHLFEPV